MYVYIYIYIYTYIFIHMLCIQSRLSQDRQSLPHITLDRGGGFELPSQRAVKLEDNQPVSIRQHTSTYVRGRERERAINMYLGFRV